MNISHQDLISYASELLLPTLVLLAIVFIIVMLRQWLKRIRANRPTALLLAPVLKCARMLFLVVALYALVRGYTVMTGISLPEQGLYITLVLAISFLLLVVPYRWLDVAVHFHKQYPGGKRYPWSKYALIYRTPARIGLGLVYFLIVLETTGFDIKTLLLAGGIGGLIAGLALKELLSDFFSGLSLHATPLLNPGDVIRLSDRNIEGTITDMGFRMTRLMTFERRPLLLPNSLITSSVIEHLSHIQSRRIQFVVGIRYDDYGVVKDIIAEMRAEIPNRPSMVDQSSSLIFFREFGQYSIDILVRVFTEKTDYREYCLERESILHHTAAIVLRHGAEFAFPTSEIHLHKNQNDSPGSDMPPSKRSLL